VTRLLIGAVAVAAGIFAVGMPPPPKPPAAAGASTALGAAVSRAGAGPVVPGAVVTQGFGCTDVTFEPYQPACPSLHFHAGIDLAAPTGTPVHAAAAGVLHAVHSAGGYGTHIVVDQGGGFLQLYGHLSAIAAPDGALVAAGEVIGLVGSTGLSTGPHLHFEVRRNGVPINPAPWLGGQGPDAGPPAGPV
jgi:murein DD-endopeptidase MepM/ murein hydrolase activator NlpD